MRDYRGLTWDHPRGRNALRAAAAEPGPGQRVAIAWDSQPLEGFESHPIAELASRYDLVVFDHPHVGAAVESGSFLSLEDVFPSDDLAGLADATIGPCFESYCYGGRHWALPLDAASQVMAYRPDLTDPLGTWDEVRRLGEAGGVALSLAGPHAILSWFSIAAAMGEPPAEREPRLLATEAIGAAAFDLLAAVFAHAERSVLELNPIGLLEYMASHDGVRMCPLVFGYVNYTRPADGAHSLAFANVPSIGPGGRPGSTLGGTGIGISRRCKLAPELLSHLRWLLGAEAQCRFIPDHDGQPSRREAWNDTAVNAAWGNFYAATAASLEAAYVRPRYDGYIAFQAAASSYVRQALEDGVSGLDAARTLNRMHTAAIGDQQQ